MAASHHENMGGLIHQLVGEGLASRLGNIHAPGAQDLDGVRAGRLTVAGGHPGGTDLDIRMLLNGVTKQALSHGAAADIASADKKDVFHKGRFERP